jgi:(4-(4-[2-(gamma-L-glutamylamino)ethyl]phenoxymethyl)furan-2-yl)methanamine synthase
MAASTILGLDIGGANLKAATPDKRAVSVPFALWKQPDRLPAALAELVARFPDAEELAVTMTGELCDCYETKREGVSAIIKAVRFASAGRRIRVWSTDGVFVNDNDAKANHMKVAAANWHALATFAGQFVPEGPATLIDIGSTTTDVIPMLDGQPVARGRTDHERLRYSELVYTGVRRTPIMALIGERVAAENFATSLDVYLWLGLIPEEPGCTDTADGRPATRLHAFNRLCRMLGGDREWIGEEAIENLCLDVITRQASLIGNAFGRVWNVIGERIADQARRAFRERPQTPIVSGSGEFLLRQAFERGWIYDGADRGVELVLLSDKLDHQLSACAPAYAVAVLASERRD